MNTVTSIKSVTPPEYLKEGMVKLTPAQANHIVTNLRYDRQRDESRAKDHINNLREQMRRGMWQPKSQLDFARIDGQLILVNGHHRMAAQSGSGKDIVWNIAIHPCVHEGEVRTLYTRFDTNLRKRSNANILQGIGFTETTKLPKQYADALFRAMPVLAAGLDATRGGGANGPKMALIDDKLRWAHDYIPEAQKLQPCMSQAPHFVRRKLLKGSIFAVALASMRADEIKSQSFWHGLSENDGLRREDPRAKLLQWLNSTDMNSGAKNAGLVVSVKAWNAHCRGSTIKHLKVNTGHTVHMAGTGYEVRA